MKSLIITNTHMFLVEDKQEHNSLHFCIDVHSGNAQHPTENYINPVRIWTNTDNCKTCMHILKYLPLTKFVDKYSIELLKQDDVSELFK